VNRSNLFGDTPLLVATRRGNVETALALVELGAEIECETENLESPLFFAARAGSLELVRQLLEKGADPNHNNVSSVSPLHVAISSGHAEVAKLLLEARADPNDADLAGMTVLMFAASFGDNVITKLLLSHGASVQTRQNSTGLVALHYAAAAANPDVITTLLEARADPLAKDNGGRTPRDALEPQLEHGDFRSCINILRQAEGLAPLTEAELDALIYGTSNNTATGPVITVECASPSRSSLPKGTNRKFTSSDKGGPEEGDIQNILTDPANQDTKLPPEVVIPKELLEAVIQKRKAFRAKKFELLKNAPPVDAIQANPEVQRRQEQQPSGPMAPTVDALAQAHAELESKRNAELAAVPPDYRDHLDEISIEERELADKELEAILTSIGMGDRSSFHRLLRLGAPIDDCDSNGISPLQLAAELGDLDTVNTLLTCGADPNLSNFMTGRSPLILAAMGNHYRIVRALLEKGANVNASDHAHHRALHFAAATDGVETARMLLRFKAEVDPQDHMDNTPLMMAAESGSLRVLRLLLEAGANPHLSNEDKARAMDFAVDFKQTEIIDELKKHETQPASSTTQSIGSSDK